MIKILFILLVITFNVTASITNYAKYTPVFSGVGTVVDVEFYCRFVGNNIEVMGKWRNGTVMAAPATITLPKKVVPDTKKIGKNNFLGTKSSNSSVFQRF